MARIKDIKPLDDYILLVEFDDGERVFYDVKEDIETLEDFKILKSQHNLFRNVQLDSSRTCVYWSDRIDLSSDTILEYGRIA